VKDFEIYLVAYVVLTIGAMIALSEVGVMPSVAPIWIVVGLLVTAGICSTLVVSAGKPTMTESR